MKECVWGSSSIADIPLLTPSESLADLPWSARVTIATGGSGYAWRDSALHTNYVRSCSHGARRRKKGTAHTLSTRSPTRSHVMCAVCTWTSSALAPVWRQRTPCVLMPVANSDN